MAVTRRFAALWLAVICGWADIAPRPLAAQRALPDALPDREFWQLFTTMSEESGAFPSENFVSNEKTYQHVIPTLQRTLTPNGVYLGVGPEQNFTYIVNLRPRLAVIIDIRRQNAMLHLMYKAVFELSSSRAEFVSHLFSRPLAASLSSSATPAEIVDAVAATPASDSAFDANWSAIVRRLTVTHGFALSDADLASMRHVFETFREAGPDISFAFHLGAPPSATPWLVTFAQLQSLTNADGVNMAFLATEANYRWLRALETRNMVVPVVGDFAGPKALRAVGEYIRQRGAVVTAFYVSNVEQYLFAGFEADRRFYRSVEALPIDSTSSFIRSLPAGSVPVLPPPAAVSSTGAFISGIAPIKATLDAFANGQLTTYARVSAMTRTDGWQATAPGAALTGRYRNLFVEAGHTPADVSAKIEGAFHQLFHGDSATQSVYYGAGRNANGPLAYVTDINNHDVRTEGMSYGMMIAVELDKKAEFDALWNWSKTYMYHDDPKHPSYGFFSWSMKTDGTPNSESPAPDGEEYYAMALYFASARWGDGQGIYDYRAAADRLLLDMKNRGPISGAEAGGRRETEYAEFNPVHKMVRFTPDTARRDHTDPSYHLPAFYELWARWGPPADRQFWADAARASRDFFPKATHPQTGLAPDYANFDGTPVGFGPANRGATFAADAWRTAANWSVDWSWWAADSRERMLSDRIQSFFMSQGIDRYGSKFSLDGRQVNDSAHATALVATNAVASLAATDSVRAATFVRALWDTPIPTGRYRYYDGLWYLMALMHDGGAFRVWTPRWAR